MLHKFSIWVNFISELGWQIISIAWCKIVRHKVRHMPARYVSICEMIFNCVWPVSRVLALVYVLISTHWNINIFTDANFFLLSVSYLCCVFCIYFYCLQYGRRTEIVHVLLHSAIISQMWRCGKMTASNSKK